MLPLGLANMSIALARNAIAPSTRTAGLQCFELAALTLRLGKVPFEVLANLKFISAGYLRRLVNPATPRLAWNSLSSFRFHQKD